MAGWNDLSDDHPLYSENNVSPTLQISATGTSFTFDLKQTLPIDYTTDDLPVQIKGTLKNNIDNQGERDLWDYDLTITYESSLNGPFGGTADILTVNGFFRHIFAPHPEKGEITPASPLNIFVSLSEELNQGNLPKTITEKGKLESRIHLNNPNDSDILTKLFLEARQTEDDQFDSWRLRIEGQHACLPPENQNPRSFNISSSAVCVPPPIPEPSSTIGFLTLGILGGGATLKRKLKSANSTKK